MPGKTPKLPVSQLLILSICRFAEPVVYTSVLPYLPEMIEDIGIPKNEVARWVGITSAVTSSCQAAMAVSWGTASDTLGRKPIILCGLTFTMIFSLMFGMSKTMGMLLVSRAFLGFMNGNVGIIRTMVAEMVPEKELQPRAFSIMPLVWTIGSIFGPAFGGALARPAEKHPEIFGNWDLLKEYPFLLPNMVSALLFVIGITTGFLFLHETLAAKKHQSDVGVRLGQALTSGCTGRRQKSLYLETQEDDERTALLGNHGKASRSTGKATKRPSWKEVFSPQSTLVLAAYSMLAMHNMAFDSLLPVFLHTPLQRLDGNPDVKLPFKFIGGFGVDSQRIGMYYTLIGIIGMFVQFFIFPTAAKRFGVLNCLKVVSIIFPIIYFLTPFMALTPASVRSYVVFMLMLTKLACTIFGFPCCTIMMTNSATSLSVLGTLNGVGTSVSAVGRAAGPALVGATFSYGVSRGYVILPWWILAVFGALSAVPLFWVVESDGFQGDQSSEDEETDD
ncbi:MFS transporter [Aspergillus clavatus NRRL 1]|uniref:MFS transporter, putative n=1 Tax=Aspergillus clavatus (strain ATCC 1007 / CBS 513.65 / DSM 816 / NCTC 3887 / NRRL 1 / QM 1276 / 107) TaxID=344612 RepID=A1CRT4_ASPCL|nr:MFS transporter, putative [Aspergillus clavatus NRRL 1]EAW08355.1 MFS transporter, putative [Aspergillus clavatus NRRL 1]